MEVSTIVLVPQVQVVLIAAFVLLAVAAVSDAPRSGWAGWWAAGAFGALAMALSALWLPDRFGATAPGWLEQLGLILLLAFPYLLLRFTAAFRDLPRWLQHVAAAVGVLAVAAVLVPQRPYLILALSYWAGVSLVSVATLWRAGRGQPGVIRRRMRLMAAAAAVLTAALLTAIQLGSEPLPEVLAYGFALVSALAFGLGYRPPRSLRLAWRRKEDEQLQAATTALLRADTAEEVAFRLLPPTVGIMGGKGAALVDADGRVAASYGRAPAVGEPVDELGGGEGRGVHETVSLGEGYGRLVVWTSAYTPFFGPEERGLFRSMAAIAGLALERCARLADEQAQRAALERANEQAGRARNEAEEARQAADEANRAKTDFLSRMSHELRTPLNAILGFGQLLELARLEPEDQEGVGHILKAGRHLLALIDDVLDLSRIEAGMLTISLEPVHVGELIQDTIRLVEPMTNARSIRIATESWDDAGYVLTDRQRCRQALLNLLSNAVKYNHDHGSVVVTCSPISNEMLRIAVCDTGRGIDPARHSRIFQPFERLGAESSTVEGTGLGLALTKQLIERLGGAIGVESTPNQGSTFWIDVPLTAAPTAPEASEDVPVAPVSTGEYQLLLVEDNLANLRLVEAMLRRRPGVSVLPAMQGTLALDLAYEHRPDLIILDLHLPDLSGREILNRLKADPRTRDIPVVIASADATPRRVSQLLDEGAIDYLTKPLELQRFLEVVDTALGTARIESA